MELALFLQKCIPRANSPVAWVGTECEAALREMQINALKRCHFTPARRAKIKRHMITSAGQDVEKLEPSHSAGGILNGSAALENSLAAPQKVIHRIAV